MVDDSYSRKAKDITAGFIGGATQVLIGQPADLVKIRLQTARTKVSSAEIIRLVWRNEGPLAFYKGTVAPLFGVGACVSLQFYGFLEAQRQLLKRSGKDSLLLWPETYVAGAVAGLVNTPVTAPVEQMRILSQSNTGLTTLSQTVRKVYASQGWRGIFRGITVTLMREMQAYGVWFLCYESMLAKMKGARKRLEVSTWELLACGAVAGNAFWLSSYPLDVIKSNIQSDGFGKDSKFGGSIVKAARSIHALAGLAGFWKGIVPCLLRAAPCSAGTFAAVETALRVMG